MCWSGRMRSAALDLLLGGRCAGCRAPGPALCADCSLLLADPPRPAWPDPTPLGLCPPWAGADHVGPVREAIVAFKEHQLLAVGPMLAQPLARAVAAATRPDAPVLLVPVPTRRATERARGHSPVLSLTRWAARALRAAGVDVDVARLLRVSGGVADQADLGAAARAANLAETMWCDGAALRRWHRRRGRAQVVVCDDVITTGSTLRESQRALEAVGVRPCGHATVARVPRRRG